MIMKSGGLGRGDGDLEGGVLGGVLEDGVSLVHLGEGERVRAHLLRRDAAAGHQLQQGRDGHPVSPGTREPLTDVISRAIAGARRYYPGQESRQTRRNSSFPV